MADERTRKAGPVVIEGRFGTPQAKAPSAVPDRLANCGALMAKAQTGDRRAYAALLTDCQAWLRPYLAKRLAPDLVEDVSQEILLAVHVKRHTYDPARPFAPWFVGVARHKWIDRLRAVYREPGKDELNEDTGSTGSHEGAVLSAVLLEGLLGHLSDAQATAIRLVKLDGLSVEEASLQSGQSASAIKVNIHRGRKAMMKRLGEAHD